MKVSFLSQCRVNVPCEFIWSGPLPAGAGAARLEVSESVAIDCPALFGESRFVFKSRSIQSNRLSGIFGQLRPSFSLSKSTSRTTA